MFAFLVFLTVLLVATCGLIYEFIAATLSSYLLGSGITQFSIVIGVFLSALGGGAYLSRFVKREIARRFIEVELAVALLGGLAPLVLFASFVRPSAFLPSLYATVTLQGGLVGLEIPLVLRLLRRRVKFKDLVSRALAFDYLGALLAGVLFSLVLLPHLGLIRTGIVFGIVNALVGLSGTWLFASTLGPCRNLRLRAGSVIFLLMVALFLSEQLTRSAETLLYADPIVYARQTKFQRIVLTSGRGGFHLFLDGNLQFSSLDEYRYHEALVHPVFSQTSSVRRVLVLGGGDGLAVREILHHPEVEDVTLVDIDPGMTELAQHQPVITKLNAKALQDPRVHVVNDDAMVWLGKGHSEFDVVVIDFPDPNNYTLGKLYTTRFYRLVLSRLEEGGAFVVQATSPLVARQSFWCVVSTLEAVGLQVLPYHAFVPSFGEWGFVLAARHPLRREARVLPSARYVNEETIPTLFVFSPDMQRIPAEVNRLSSQVLVRYYESDWRKMQ